jgi:Flp pilus assembly protein TadG
MIDLRRRRRLHRRDDTGATLVEFALVAPLLFVLLFGLISGCFLVYQNSALHSGASAGARMASIENPLVNGSGCESGLPVTIASAVAGAAPLLKVNNAPLCENGVTNQLTQTAVDGEVNITVTCGGTCASPSTVQVALALTTKGLVAPIGLNYSMTAKSQVPVVTP